jgi:protocatechuate 3,4-dioxygenase beta subunit
MDESTRISRRASLARLGGLLAGAVAVGGSRVSDSIGATDGEALGDGPAAVASGAVTCVLAPEQTEGPYYLDDAKIRRNIVEGKAGVPLALRLTVVDASSCKPIKGAAVDVWHCDAAGVYSGTSAQGTEDDRFLRGVQRTDAKGVALFRTIYPGWYRGRTVHIHVMVHIGGNVVHTGQLYFSDAVTDAVYRRSPYNRRANRDPRNVGDSIYRNGGKRSTLKLARSGSGYTGRITMGVVRA